MQIPCNSKTDLLYLRVDDRKGRVPKNRASDDLVLDVGEDHRIVGIEILDASHQVNLTKLLPVNYEVPT